MTRVGKKLGVGRKLNKDQETEIFNLITKRRPFQLGFTLPYKNTKQFLWTRDLLMQLILRKFDIKLSDGGLVNYLTRWGFPALNRLQSKETQCHIAIRTWLELHQQAMITRSKAEKAIIYWVGEMATIGLQFSETDRSRTSKMISVISNQGRVHWLTIKGQFNPERQVMLLKSLVGQTNAKIFLIRNTLPYFTNNLTTHWLDANKTHIEIFPPKEWSKN